MSAALHPYPVNARVRTAQKWGSIAVIVKNGAGLSLSSPQYHVCYDDGKVEIIEHADIVECFNNGMPFVTVLVERETFAKFAADENYVTFQTVSPKKNGKVSQTRGNVILWRDNYWICTGGAWIETAADARCETYDDFVLAYVEIELVVPRAEFDGELVAPHYGNISNFGYLLLAPDGEFVCTGIVANLAPMPQPRVDIPAHVPITTGQQLTLAI